MTIDWKKKEVLHFGAKGGALNIRKYVFFEELPLWTGLVCRLELVEEVAG